MEGTSLKNIILGFIAGAIATVTVHEFICYYFYTAGLFPRQPWPNTPAHLTGVPQYVSDMAWGGLWGSIFSLILGDHPQGSMTLRGALLGILLPAVVGVFILVPLLTGRFPMFFGGDITMIWPVLVILAGFGAATAWLYGFFSSGFRLP
jgi:hypothetical protein